MGKIIADPWRGLNFYDPLWDKDAHVLIVGAGAIGSYTAFGLARMGVKQLTLVDYDIVEAHNLPNQFFAESLDLTDSLFKVEVLKSTINLIVKDVTINTFNGKYEEIPPDFLRNYRRITTVITAVDDMESRKNIFKNYRGTRTILLDSRTGGLYANIYGIKLWLEKECQFYEKTLHTNEEAIQLPCSGQSIVDTSMAVSAELIGRYRTLAMEKYHPTLHSFHDYSTGQAWIMTARENNGTEQNGTMPLTKENIAKI